MRISIRDLRKTFRFRGERISAIDGVTLEVADGELVVILGPSGSGKTTFLRCIAGLERADDGEIEIDGKLAFSAKRRVWLPPERRGISMVFQSYALWPHMTVFDNVRYPLEGQGLGSEQMGRRVREALEMVGCANLERRHPSELSGGQQQRVALARAITASTRVVLFDEPLSSVDAQVREELRLELRSLQRRLGFSAIYVTHDQTEATILGDRVAIMNAGRVVQLGTPREVYDEPHSTFVAEFMGAANSLRGTVEREMGGRFVVRTEIGSILAAPEHSNGTHVGSEVRLVFRPEYCRISQTPAENENNRWACTVERSVFLGHCTEYLARVRSIGIVAKVMGRLRFDEGASAWISINPEDVRVLTVE